MQIEPKIGTHQERSGGSKSSRPAPEEAKKTLRDRTHKGRVLILDNDPVVRDVVTDMLRSIGYTAYAAETVDEAADCYHQAKRCGFPFQTVLIDLTSARPDREREPAARFPGDDRQVNTIAMSGANAERTARECSRRGIRVALWKPFTLHELEQALAPGSVRSEINSPRREERM